MIDMRGLFAYNYSLARVEFVFVENNACVEIEPSLAQNCTS